jgi:hypothetical protein
MDGMDYELAELHHHWGEAYLITHPEPDLWIAQRRDTRETLRAASADELYRAILADYSRKPVPR